MRIDQWERVKQLYSKALDLEPGQRQEYLDTVCAGDPSGRADIEALLAFEQHARGFLETPALDVVAKAIVAGEYGWDLAGRTLVHYRVIERIGAGGMGVVYRAHDERLQRDVAIKVLNAPAIYNTGLTWTLQEARAAAALNHPAICTVHEVIEQDGYACIVMELISGERLDARLARCGAMGADDSLEYAMQLADALAHAHERGILHGDLKSANIIATAGGRLKVLDFGLARPAGKDAPSSIVEVEPTVPVPLGGTPAYMSPEKVRGEPGDARSDIWSLGVVLYEMLAGYRPFQGRTPRELDFAILNESFEALPARLPADLCAVVERCLRKSPDARYQTCADVRASLRALTVLRQVKGLQDTGGEAVLCISEKSPKSLPTTRANSTALRKYRSLLRWTAALVFTVVVAIAAWTVLRSHRQQARAPGPQRIAVLPFENLSRDSGDVYLVKAIHESLITDLHRFTGLRVIGRRSVMPFENSRKPLPQIVLELSGVDAVVTGIVSSAGGRVELSMQLLDAKTGHIRWAERYRADFADIPHLRQGIVGAVAEVMGLKAVGMRPRRTLRPVHPDTYALYAKGRFFLNQLTPDGLAKGIEYLKSAVESDPSEPLASAAVALGYVLIAHQVSNAAVADPFQLAKPYALRAVELDPGLPEAHQALAEIKAYRDWDFSGADEEYRRALELSNGNIAEAHANYSWYLMLGGRTREQLAEMKAAIDLDPLNPVYHVWLGQQYAIAGLWNDARAQARRALELNPELPDGLVLLGHTFAQRGMFRDALACHERAAAVDSGLSRYTLACTYARLNRREDARRIADELRKHLRPWDSYGLAAIYAALNEGDQAMYWLEQMYEGRHMYTPWVRIGPEFANLRADPRFQELVARIRF